MADMQPRRPLPDYPVYVKPITKHSVLLGDRLVLRWCESVPDDQPLLAKWEDGAGYFVLTDEPGYPEPGPVEDSMFRLTKDLGLGLIRQYDLGHDTICYVRHRYYWDVMPEPSIVAFVNETFPSIPTWKMLYWHDAGAYTIQLTRRPAGKRLAEAWHTLSKEQQHNVVEEIVDYSMLMITLTSDMLCGADKGPTCENWLNPDKERLDPLDNTFKPLTHSEAVKGFAMPPDSAIQAPELPKEFHFFHPDLGVDFVWVNEKGSVTAITEWESAGFYPLHWLTTKMSVHPQYSFEDPPLGVGRHEWKLALLRGFHDEGLESYTEWYIAWFCHKKGLDPVKFREECEWCEEQQLSQSAGDA